MWKTRYIIHIVIHIFYKLTTFLKGYPTNNLRKFIEIQALKQCI